jgi:hypothetical protein
MDTLSLNGFYALLNNSISHGLMAYDLARHEGAAMKA